MTAIVGKKANTVSSATVLPYAAVLGFVRKVKVLGFVRKVKGTGCSESKMGENSACIMLAQQDQPERVWSVGRSLAEAIEGDHSLGCNWEIKYAEHSSSCMSPVSCLVWERIFMSWTLILLKFG